MGKVIFISKKAKDKKKVAKFCYYCFRPLMYVQNSVVQHATLPTIDHFIPLVHGGNNFQYNLVICCYCCNQTKGNLLPDEFCNYINELLRGNDFRYSKQELINILQQVNYIKRHYEVSASKKSPYYLTKIPTPKRQMGTLEALRKKYTTKCETTLTHYA